jgi:hypothetical protein
MVSNLELYGVERGKNAKPQQPEGSMSHALTEVNEVSSRFSPLRQGDFALASAVGDKHAKSNFVVQDSVGRTYFDMEVAGYPYGSGSPFSETAVTAADKNALKKAYTG